MYFMDIEKIDRYMARCAIDYTDIEFFDPRDGGFILEGFYWFKDHSRYHRLPS